jgi:hypothetical protein
MSTLEAVNCRYLKGAILELKSVDSPGSDIDVNNYINSRIKCADSQTCTIKAFFNAMNNPGWTGSALWDTEVAAGQNPESNPTAPIASLHSCLTLRPALVPVLPASITPSHGIVVGSTGRLSTSAGATKPAFTVLTDRENSYGALPAHGDVTL